MAERRIYWQPQAGPQAEACICPADEIGYGGARGGGKSDLLIGRQLLGAERWKAKWNGLILRRNYKDLAEIRRRIDGLIAEGMPAERIGGDQQPNTVRFGNGATLALAAIERLDAADDYQGQQIPEIGIDEGAALPYLSALVEKLKGVNRSPHGIPCHIVVTGNPGGAGHLQFRQRYVDPAIPGDIFTTANGDTRCFIASKLDDNRVLVEADPAYARRLKSISDPALRAAWLDGDWSVNTGQAFEWAADLHVVQPLPVPDVGTLLMTYDWGFGAPFSVGWWWRDGDRRLYRFAEWYGASSPGEGLRLTDAEVAQGIREREDRMGLAGRPIRRLAGHDCFQRRADYRQGGQVPSTADTWAQYGLRLEPGDVARHQKLRAFRERMHIARDDSGKALGLPMLVVYPQCRDFVRTVPCLAMSAQDPEDLDSEQEDHVYDEACHAVMATEFVAPLASVPLPKWVSRGDTL